jgi:Ni,Fe-hydrogenase III small subunit
MSIYRRSIWVFHLNTGSCNACDIEILDVLTPYHDVERFGIKLVASPRHADALLLTGPITRESLPKVIDALLAVPEPKLVIAIGSCTCGGGIWYDTYSTLGGLNELYRVLKEEYGISEPPTVKVPGCPPRPEAIIYGVALALGIVKQKYSTIKVRVE